MDETQNQAVGDQALPADPPFPPPNMEDLREQLRKMENMFRVTFELWMTEKSKQDKKEEANDSKKYEALEILIAALKEQVEDERKKKEDEVNDERRKNEEATRENESLLRQIQRLKDESEEARREAEELKDSMKKKCDEVKREIVTLKRAVDDERKKKEDSIRNKEKLERENISLKESASETNSQLAILQDKFAELQLQQVAHTVPDHNMNDAGGDADPAGEESILSEGTAPIDGSSLKFNKSMTDSDDDSIPPVNKSISDSVKKNGNKRNLSSGNNESGGNVNHGAKKSDTDIECPKCEYRTRFVKTWRGHLSVKHSTTPYQAGVALLCECGAECYSENHNYTCEVANYTVIQKKKINPQKCVLCDAYPKTACGYALHLKDRHKSTLRGNGIYLTCSCGLVVRTRQDYKHIKKCDGLQYSLHKIDDMFESLENDKKKTGSTPRGDTTTGKAKDKEEKGMIEIRRITSETSNSDECSHVVSSTKKTAAAATVNKTGEAAKTTERVTKNQEAVNRVRASSDEEEDNWVLNCICGQTEDDGEACIGCDQCLVRWEHVECIFPRTKKVPPGLYFCHVCKPRPTELTPEQARSYQDRIKMQKEEKKKKLMQKRAE